MAAWRRHVLTAERYGTVTLAAASLALRSTPPNQPDGPRTPRQAVVCASCPSLSCNTHTGWWCRMLQRLREKVKAGACSVMDLGWARQLLQVSSKDITKPYGGHLNINAKRQV